MKRWIRRILLGISLTAVCMSMALSARGLFVSDSIFIYRVWIWNEFSGVQVVDLNSQLQFRHFEHHASMQDLEWLPRVRFNRLERVVFVIPHWLVAVLGSVYLTVWWIQRRKRTAEVGFPVEAKAVTADASG